MPQNHHQDQPVPVLALLLGWLLPGLGHISVGQRRRGFLIMSGVLFLVLCGALVGGIDAVDHNNDVLWFIAQIWCGPIVIGIDMLNQWLIAPMPVAQKATYVGLSHANEIGTLFIAMAGLMNFVVLLDLFQTKQGQDLERRESRSVEDTT